MMEVIDKNRLLSYLADLFLTEAGEQTRVQWGTAWAEAFAVVDGFNTITLEDGLYQVQGGEIRKYKGKGLKHAKRMVEE